MLGELADAADHHDRGVAVGRQLGGPLAQLGLREVHRARDMQVGVLVERADVHDEGLRGAGQFLDEDAGWDQRGLHRRDLAYCWAYLDARDCHWVVYRLECV